MGASDWFRQLVEKWFLDFGEFRRIHDFKDILDFI